MRFPRITRDSTRDEGLDSLRALFVAVVIVGHLYPLPLGLAPLGAGSVGVSAFFVLSGFVITRALLRADVSNGQGLRRFYIARCFRILPALFAYLTAVVLFLHLVGRPLTICQLVTSAALLENYSPCAHPWLTGHLWSVAVEWQFYLIWPALLISMRRDLVIKGLVVAVCAGPLVRLVQYAAIEPLRGYIGIELHTRLDALAMGCLLAFLVKESRFVDAARRYRLQLLLVGTIGLIGTAYLNAWLGGPYRLPVGFTVEALSAALVIASVAMQTPATLRARPLVALGTISYSAYLWQQFAAEVLGRGPVTRELALVAVLAAAVVSRVAVEQPFILLGRKLSARGHRPTTHSGHGSSKGYKLDTPTELVSEEVSS